MFPLSRPALEFSHRKHYGSEDDMIRFGRENLVHTLIVSEVEDLTQQTNIIHRILKECVLLQTLVVGSFLYTEPKRIISDTIFGNGFLMAFNISEIDFVK